MSRIRVLADHVANQIAAGEVVDRPASVVKELVENSLDAEAQRVRVHLRAGGRELVAVEDDGTGMDEDDAMACFDRHATSKLRDSEDLLAIATLGFRGEALPSIASVAKVHLKTRAREQETGTEVLLKGGTIERVGPIAWPGGTSIEVRSLFFNTPARKKFLRTEPTELRYISSMLTRLALARPDVHFVCTHNERPLLELVPYAQKLDRIADLYGPKLARSLTRLQRKAGGLELEAYVGPVHDNKPGGEYVHLFINGRAVRSPIVTAALQDAFHLVVPKGRLPVTLLYLQMPPSEVDVNVHPTKAEVRFYSPGAVREFLTRTLQEHLGAGAKGVLPEMSLGRDRNEKIRLALDSVYPEKRAVVVPEGAEPAWMPRPLAQQPAPGSRQPDSPAQQRPPQAAPLRLAELRYIGQLADTFLLLEDEEGLVVVDQHVAHERVRVEELIEGARSGRQAVQPLLVPEVVELAPAEGLALERGQEVLSRLGFEIDPLGPGSVAVRAAPAALPLADLEETLRTLARRLQSEGGPAPDPAELIEEALVMAACKGAIKAHDPLSPQQARALLEKLDHARHPFSCPHGRPAYFRLPLHQIEREFGRLGFA
jgi:DNA mismatch repair protein MutL